MSTEIAIIGGGVGGLTLARTLAVHGIEAVVYERDASAAARSQGGSLDLHPDTGQRALAEAGLIEEFWSIARPEAAALRIVDPTGTTLVDRVPDPGAPPARPEVDRAELRRLLLSSLPGGVLSWDHRLEDVTERRCGGFTLHFEPGGTVDCDVLVGADGAYSRVRRLLTDLEPTYTGVTYVDLGIRDADRKESALAELIGPGSLWCLGGSVNLTAQRSGDGRIRVSVTVRADYDWLKASGLDESDLSGARAILLDLLAGWNPRLTALIAASDEGFAARRIETLPIGLRWESRPDLTLIGDAAHLMPPVGEGANQAMLDGAELALAMAHPSDPATAIRTYEEEMFARTRIVAEDSARMEALLTSPTAATDMAKFFSAHR